VNNEQYRNLPSVEKLTQQLDHRGLPRPLVVQTVRGIVESARNNGNVPEPAAIHETAQQQLADLAQKRLQPVLNGTGIVLHTNLGRAPLSTAAAEAIQQLSRGYCNLELDLATGERGGRAAYLELLLAHITGAEAATVVNNCAAALVLILKQFGSGREVLISRGELVQIGGGFRIPEILETSGARLKEVGTTNHTTVADYEKGIGPDAGIILKVHRSNFGMSGFVEEPSRTELRDLANRTGLLFVEDLGSGAVIEMENKSAGLPHEPTVQECIAGGVDLVCFSGDKLFGGPQAGIIVGRQRLVERLKRHQFFRALRCDKLVFAALQATAEEYLKSPNQVPVHHLLATTNEDLRRRAEAIIIQSGFSSRVTLVEEQTQVGGGTLPMATVPSLAIAIPARNGAVDQMQSRALRLTPPLVGYVRADKFLINLRTILPEQDALLSSALQQVIKD
jgi:L-seryl-tRNA(Ser) seleniumtransferase